MIRDGLKIVLAVVEDVVKLLVCRQVPPERRFGRLAHAFGDGDNHGANSSSAKGLHLDFDGDGRLRRAPCARSTPGFASLRWPD